jgi:2-oxoglutarate ferredoxin oxidoreductase subunit gamma
MMGVTGICFAGFGGQGVILAGMIVGRAAALYDGNFATLTQSFGPEARGSACSAQLLVSSEPILYPYVTQPDILVPMSQEAYRRFAHTLRPGGILLYEEELVKPDETTRDVNKLGVPATRFAEELGRRVVLNLVMVGFATAVTRIASPEAVRQAIPDSVPPGTESLNVTAFEKGLLHGLQKLSDPRAA